MLLAVRAQPEDVFLDVVRRDVGDIGADEHADAEMDSLCVEPVDGTGPSYHLRDQGAWRQMQEYFVHRSLYHLKDAFRLSPVPARRRERPGRGSKHMRFEARANGVDRGGAHAHVLGEAADPDPVYSAAAQLLRQSGAVEIGILLPFRALRLRDDERAGRQAQPRMKFGAVAPLHAMLRPGPAERREARMIRRVPVARGDDLCAGRRGLVDQLVDDRHDIVAFRDGELSARAKVPLQIDDQQGVVQAQPDLRTRHRGFLSVCPYSHMVRVSRFARSVWTPMSSIMPSDQGNAFAGSVSTADKVRHLSRSAAYAHAPTDVAVVETHMSYVFLAGDRAYKLKKPVRFAFLDFSTLRAREIDSVEEVRLGRRLAPGVYLGVVPLTLSASGALSIRGDGAVADWLVEMRRLPDALMLDRLLTEKSLDESRIDRLGETLADFYRRAERSTMSPADYVARFFREHAESRNILTRRDFALDHGRVPVVLDRLEASLIKLSPLLEARVRSRRVVDGHGDLRPEHICFCDPIAIFDCLEFNHELRQVDPFDELAFLDVECALLGAPLFGPKLIAGTAKRLGDAPPAALIALYGACRAVLRARLAVAHLLDPVPRKPETWEPLAGRYMRLAEVRMAAIG